MDCKTCIEMMNSVLDGEEQRTAIFDEHLENCAACKSEFEALAIIKKAVAGQEQDVPADFREKWQKRLRDAHALPANKSTFKSNVLKYGSIAAVLVIGLGAWYGASTQRSAKNEMAPMMMAAQDSAIASDAIYGSEGEQKYLAENSLEHSDSMVSEQPAACPTAPPENESEGGGASDTGEAPMPFAIVQTEDDDCLPAEEENCNPSIPIDGEDSYASLEYKLSGLAEAKLVEVLDAALLRYKSDYIKSDTSYSLVLTEAELSALLEVLISKGIALEKIETSAFLENYVSFYFK